MFSFIMEHGPNDWNHLPPDDVRAHLNRISDGSVQAIIARDGDDVMGFITYFLSDHLNRYQQPANSDQQHGYIGEAVVSHNHAGQGVGTRLLNAAVEKLKAFQIKEIFVERHEENPGSAGMMRKAGFEIIDTIDEPERRANGSRRTSICQLSVNETAALHQYL